MSEREPHPTRDELMAMAYVDGELAPESRAEFEARLSRDPEMARLVVEYQRIELVARTAAPPEPMDHEWERLGKEGLQRTGIALGWLLVIAAGIGGAVYIGVEIASSDDDPLAKALIAALAGGFALLFLTTLRGRLRTLPYDPYTKVQR